MPGDVRERGPQQLAAQPAAPGVGGARPAGALGHVLGAAAGDLHRDYGSGCTWASGVSGWETHGTGVRLHLEDGEVLDGRRGRRDRHRRPQTAPTPTRRLLAAAGLGIAALTLTCAADATLAFSRLTRVVLGL